MTTKRGSKRKQDEAKSAKRLKPDKEAIADLQPSAKSNDVKGGGVRKAGGGQQEY